MIADYHVHTPYCGHAKGKIIDYINSAIAMGLQEIGFSDHLGRYYLTSPQRRRYWDWGMEERDLARYVAELLELREIYEERITIKIGLEADYIEGAEDLLETVIGRYPLDFVLGSIHCIPQLGWKHLSNYAQLTDTSLVYGEYFRIARAALRSGLFNALAHMDFVWRYIPWPTADATMPFKEIALTVEAAAASHQVIEINSNGLLWSLDHTLPCGDPFDALIDQCRSRQVPVSLGSDAHEPTMVGKLFSELIGLLQRKGFRTFACFSERTVHNEMLG
ncbi:MAG: histidinol-phosphatase HisJ family protein [Chitinispirillaceae bacterium]|nr:histidinol-phosphatase HisJ family protein [Chitinispirillaceae bacterium]